MPQLNIKSSSTQQFQKLDTVEKVFLGPLAEIRNSDIEGNFILEHYSMVNRSSVGRYCGVGVSSLISDSVIGNYTSIGSRVSIGGFEHPTDWFSTSSWQWGQGLERFDDIHGKDVFFEAKPMIKKTVIGSDCWIGNNSVVLSGVEIGHGAIVGAGSVVTKNILPFSIVVGNPAKFHRFRFEDTVIEKLLQSKWFEKDFTQLMKLGITSYVDVLKCLDYLED